MIDLGNPDYTNTPAAEGRPRYGYAPADPSASPSVSLITPFFNPGRMFEETAESVFRQSLQQWEWIIVDDCSDDPESLSILRRHLARDSRLRVLRSEERRGPAAARNLGAQAARASYLAFLDSDDLFEPTALEKWLWFLECHSQYGLVKGFQIGFGAEEYIWRQGFHSGAAILDRNLIQTASMVRREIYLAVGGMDENIRGGMEDWDFWLRCADAGHWGGTVPEALDWYRRRSSHHDRWADWDSAERQTAFREQLRRRYPNLFTKGFPQPEMSYPLPFSDLPEPPAFENRLFQAEDERRLLVLVPHLVMGGSDKFALDVISELVSKHSYKVSVAATLPSAHEWRHRFEGLTPDVFTLDTFLRLRDYPRFLSYLIRSRGIDSIWVNHSQLGYQLLPYLRAQFPGIPCYDYVHIEEPSWKQGGYPAFSIAYGSFLNRTIASSLHLKNWMVDRGGDRDKISVITINVDPEDWSRDRFDIPALLRKWNAVPDVPVILFAGRLCEQKQPHVMAAAIRSLRDRGLPFQCFVAGHGEQEPWLRDFIERYQLTQVHLLGRCSSEEIQELLAISNILFLPSRHEGISLAIFEAMAMGAAVVAADVGGQKELVTPECGILIERGEAEADRYAEALASLLADPERRLSLTKAADRIVQHFSLDRMGRQMAEVLRGAGNDGTFDLGQALRAFAPSYAREIIEQRRTELIADQLWAEHRASLAGAAGNGHRSGLATLVLPESRWSRSGWAIWAANLFRSVLLFYPLFAGRTHRWNRRLLLSALSRPALRRELLKTFDSGFYRCFNPDVPRFGPLPLLHYVFYGYHEGRRPSADYESPDFEKNPFGEARSRAQANPLLEKIVLKRRAASGSSS